MSIKHFDCDCYDHIHAMRLMYDADNKELSVEFYMDPYLGFWKRLYYGFRYIVGLEAKHDHYGGAVMGKEKTDELRAFLEEIKNELPSQD